MNIKLKDAARLFYQAVLAFQRQDFAGALSLSQQALKCEPANLVYQQAIIYLQNVGNAGKATVYATPAGFTEFIRGGGNVPLYENTSAALRQVYEEVGSLSLLDIGVGDGLALMPALATPPTNTHITTLDLIEPSTFMLNSLSQKLSDNGISHHAHNMTVQQFIAGNRGHWDIIQATFSMHTIPRAERLDLLRWLKEHGERLLLVEFDVPAFSQMLDPETVAYYVRRYQVGLAEYAGSEIVTQGFLMPIFFGNFDKNATRLTFEQPISAWGEDLRRAGFSQVKTQRLFDYWWAAAFLIEAG